MDCKELEQKVKEYEALFQEILEKDKNVSVVKAGPHQENGITYYRVATGSATQLVSFTQSALFSPPTVPLQPGTEVVVLGGTIMAIVPKQLQPPVPVPDFKLISWDEIGGLKSQLASIRSAVELPLKNKKMVKEYGLEPLKGLLLYGPPGCGKTLIARAIASVVLKDSDLAPSSFIYIKGAELLSRYVGDAEQSIRGLFHNARMYTKKTGKRSVLFIDEAEAILSARGSRISSDVDTTIVPTFLAEMDGFDDHSPFVILSTNLPNQLDSAIIRPGRIDLKIPVERPTRQDAEEIFGIHLGKVKVADGVPILAAHAAEQLFQTHHQPSGALIQSIVKLSTQKALTRKIQNSKSTPGVTIEDIELTINTLN